MGFADPLRCCMVFAKDHFRFTADDQHCDAADTPQMKLKLALKLDTAEVVRNAALPSSAVPSEAGLHRMGTVTGC